MNSKKTIALALGAFTIIAVFFAFSHFYKKQEKIKVTNSDKKNQGLLIRDYSPSIGNSMMKVSLVEFLDPECESCAYFHPFVKKILKKHEGRIHYVIRYAPFHPNSRLAIKALEGARKQNKYWETLDLLFANISEWGDHHNPQPEKIWDYLKELDLDVDAIRSDASNNEIESMIQKEIDDLEKFEIRQTPTFFLNGERLTFRSAEELEQLISSKAQ